MNEQLARWVWEFWKPMVLKYSPYVPEWEELAHQAKWEEAVRKLTGGEED